MSTGHYTKRIPNVISILPDVMPGDGTPEKEHRKICVRVEKLQ